MATLKTNEIGFLGIGQGGGNITEVAENFGYITGVINTSPEDLESIKVVRSQYLLGNEGGCAQDRDAGIRLVKKYYKEMIAFVERTFTSNVKMIFVTFTTGGGTGSSVGPILTDILRNHYAKMDDDRKNTKFIIIAASPTNDEAFAKLDNNIECLREVYKLKLPTFIVDNEKFMAKNSNKSRKDLFDLINKFIVGNYNLLFKSDLKASSKYGNVDGKEMMKLFEPAGMMFVSKAKFTEAELKEKGIDQIILSSIDTNIYAKLNKDKVVARMAFIHEVPTRLMTNSTYSKVKAELGEPIEIFDGFRELPDNATEFRVITVLSGLSFPKERITEYSEIVEEKESQINTEQEDIFDDIKKDRKSLSGKRGNISTPSSTKLTADDINLDELFKNY